MNLLTIAGNLTRDPEIRYTQSGVAKASFGVAVARRRKKGDEWIEETTFVDVVCWRDLAEHVAESLHKGDRIMVSGRLDQRTWTDREGKERQAVELVADEAGPSLRWASAEVTRNARTSKPQQADAFGGDPFS